MRQDLNEYPFTRDIIPKKDVVGGAFSEINIFKNNKKWVLKEYGDVLDDFHFPRMSNKDDLITLMTFSRFKKEIGFADGMIKNYGSDLMPFIPEHVLVYGKNDRGEEKGFIAMRRVLGCDLVKMQKVGKDVLYQLEELIEASVKFFEKTTEIDSFLGFFPDIFPPQPDDLVRFGNLMWGKIDNRDGLFFVDTYPLDPVDSAYRLCGDLREAAGRFELEHHVNFSVGFIDQITDKIALIEKNKFDKSMILS